MFSRFRKDQPAPPPSPPRRRSRRQGRAPAAGPPRSRGIRCAAAEAPPPPRPADKDRRRRQRILEIKSELHTRLLDNLNLAVVDSASEAELRAEIAAIAAEALAEMNVVLTSEERLQLNQDLFFEVKGLGPLEPLLKDDTVNDILVNGPQPVFVERAASWN
jgi:pilus assembly protein CpaF